MTIPPPKPGHASRAALAKRLTDLRKTTGLSGNAFAGRMGVVQSRVWKIEHPEKPPHLVPNEDDIKAWVTEAGREDLAGELLLLMTQARSEQAFSVEFRKQGGPAAYEERVGATEESATRIGEFQVAVIPGLFHTPEYARALLNMPAGLRWWGADDAAIEAKIGARLRRQEILYRPGKQIQVIIGEGALRTRVAPPDVMAGQLGKLLSVAQLPSVELGIIALSQPMPVYPLGFRLYDSDLVVVESIVDEDEYPAEGKADEVAAFLEAFEALRQAASTGVDAEAIIAAAAADLRERNA